MVGEEKKTLTRDDILKLIKAVDEQKDVLADLTKQINEHVIDGVYKREVDLLNQLRETRENNQKLIGEKSEILDKYEKAILEGAKPSSISLEETLKPFKETLVDLLQDHATADQKAFGKTEKLNHEQREYLEKAFRNLAEGITVYRELVSEIRKSASRLSDEVKQTTSDGLNVQNDIYRAIEASSGTIINELNQIAQARTNDLENITKNWDAFGARVWEAVEKLKDYVPGQIIQPAAEPSVHVIEKPVPYTDPEILKRLDTIVAAMQTQNANIDPELIKKIDAVIELYKKPLHEADSEVAHKLNDAIFDFAKVEAGQVEIVKRLEAIATGIQTQQPNEELMKKVDAVLKYVVPNENYEIPTQERKEAQPVDADLMQKLEKAVGDFNEVMQAAHTARETLATAGHAYEDVVNSTKWVIDNLNDSNRKLKDATEAVSRAGAASKRGWFASALIGGGVAGTITAVALLYSMDYISKEFKDVKHSAPAITEMQYYYNSNLESVKCDEKSFIMTPTDVAYCNPNAKTEGGIYFTKGLKVGGESDYSIIRVVYAKRFSENGKDAVFLVDMVQGDKLSQRNPEVFNEAKKTIEEEKEKMLGFRKKKN